MHVSRARRRPVLTVATLAILALAVPASGGVQQQAAGTFQGDGHDLLGLDARQGRVQPTGEQRSAVAAMDAMVRWNEFGTPRSLIRPSGYLASGLPADAETAARRWLNDTRDLFRLSEQDVADLELVNNAPLGDGRAVLLRQRFGSYEAGQDGLVAVAVVGGKIAYVSSSIAGATQITNAAALTAR
jgi:extracellular elastinolytic metalloproteinase